eukprot:2765923-Amphidinium_carterae.1
MDLASASPRSRFEGRLCCPSCQLCQRCRCCKCERPGDLYCATPSHCSEGRFKSNDATRCYQSWLRSQLVTS